MTVVYTKDEVEEIVLAHTNKIFSGPAPYQNVRFVEKYLDGSGEGEVFNVSHIEVKQ